MVQNLQKQVLDFGPKASKWSIQVAQNDWWFLTSAYALYVIEYSSDIEREEMDDLSQHLSIWSLFTII